MDKNVERDIESEVRARVEFKMQEFITGVKNRLAWKYGQAFDLTYRSQYIWEAYNEIYEVLLKEINLPTPYNDMALQRKKSVGNKAIDKIVGILELSDRQLEQKISRIVGAVEEAQNW